MTATLVDIARSLSGHGFETLAIANAHLDPGHLASIEAAVRAIRREVGMTVGFPNLAAKPWALRLGEEFKSGACHAGQFETSIVMAERPELVRDAIRKTLPPNPASISRAIREGKRDFDGRGRAAGLLRVSGTGHCRGGPRDGRDAGSDLGGGGSGGARMKELAGVAVVTGAGRGIGAATARALADAGLSVVLAARTREQVERQTAELAATGRRAQAVVCDVTSESSVQALAGAAAELGPVSVLVNNAGAAASMPLARTSLEDWNRLLAVNATGAFLCTRAFLPGMLERKWGRVVNVASTAGLSGGKYLAAYTAAKHALVGLTRSVAAEVTGTGVTVNAVCPGFVDTGMTAESIARIVSKTGRTPEEALAAALASAGQTRLIAAEEVAAAVVSLAGLAGAGDSPNGETLVLDGRASMGERFAIVNPEELGRTAGLEQRHAGPFGRAHAVHRGSDCSRRLRSRARGGLRLPVRWRVGQRAGRASRGGRRTRGPRATHHLCHRRGAVPGKPETAGRGLPAPHGDALSGDGAR